MKFPTVSRAEKLLPSTKRLFIGAYGFEDRLLGWVKYQQDQGDILNDAMIFRYKHPKGKNRVLALREALMKLGVTSPNDLSYDVWAPHNIENIFFKELETISSRIDEIIVDISTMTKLLILVCLCKLSNYPGTVRIVYSESEFYTPTKEEYKKSKDEREMIAKFPSQGFQSIIRMKCLSSIRMQGQPVTMIAFTSFNEQLVRHMLGTLNPHKFLFINGRPPRPDFAWRELATQEIHKSLIDEYSADNEFDKNGLLKRVASTLDYRETIACIEEIYKKFGIYERIICAATGSKMQTVGLFFCKIAHPDIHIEYPTPDSYYDKEKPRNVRETHEIIIPQFSKFLESLANSASDRINI